MNIYEKQLLNTERLYRELKAKGVSVFNPYMMELKQIMVKTIEIIEKGK